MNNTIITTKGTATARKKAGITLSILMILVGILVFAFYIYASEHTRDDSVILILFMALFLMGDGIVMTAIHYLNGSTYVEILEDRFVGKGLQNFNLQDFNIKLEQISNVTVEGIWIHIHTNIGNYKVMSNKDVASKVFNYYVNLKG